MREVAFVKADVNSPALHAALTASFGAAYVGLATGAGWVRLLVQNGFTAEQEAEAGDLVATHDPAVLTPMQEAERALLAQLDALDGPALIAQIDAITTLAEARAALKLLLRYLLRLALWLGRRVALDENHDGSST